MTKIFLKSHLFKQFSKYVCPAKYYFWAFSWIAFGILEIVLWMNATSKGFWPHFQWKGMCKISTKKYITIWPKPFWGRIYSSNQGHFLVCCSFRFSFFWSKWPKSNKSAILFVYFLYKNPHFAWKWQLIDQKMKKKMNPTLDCFWSFRNRLMNECDFKMILAPLFWGTYRICCSWNSCPWRATR